MRPVLQAAFGVAATCLTCASPAEAAPTFEKDEQTSRNGSALLKWSEGGERFEVQQADNPDFADARVIYTGPMPSAHVSGLRDGVHYFRVRAQDEDEWSNPAKLRVTHHSMALVWPLFTLGGLVFFAIGFYVLRQAWPREGSS